MSIVKIKNWGNVFFVILIFPFSVISQNNKEYFNDTLHRVNVSINASYSMGSNSLSNEFFKTIIYSEKIDDKIKDNASNRLSKKNRFGVDMNYNLAVEIPFDTLFGTSEVSLVLGVTSIEHLDGSFTDDLFDFTFYGNKQFAGETAEISGSNVSYYKYQQFDVGLYHYQLNKKVKEGVIVSVIKAERSLEIFVPTGSIFTEEFGKQVDLELNYVYHSSDTANKGITAFNGFGVTTKFFTEFILKNDDKIHVSVTDLGFIRWNKQSIEIGADSIFLYEGLVADNIFDLNDSLLTNISSDSLVEKISTTNIKKAYGTELLTSINVNYTKKINEKLKINAGIYHRIASNYFPLIYTNTYYSFSDQFVAKGHLSYGGYGKLNIGLAVAKSFNNSFNVFVGTNNIEAFIIPQSSFANSGYIGIKKFFK